MIHFKVDGSPAMATIQSLFNAAYQTAGNRIVTTPHETLVNSSPMPVENNIELLDSNNPTDVNGTDHTMRTNSNDIAYVSSFDSGIVFIAKNSEETFVYHSATSSLDAMTAFLGRMRGMNRIDDQLQVLYIIGRRAEASDDGALNGSHIANLNIILRRGVLNNNIIVLSGEQDDISYVKLDSLGHIAIVS